MTGDQPLDINALLKAVDNLNNEDIINTDTKTIKANKNDMLQKLQLPRKDLKNMHKLLREYKYVDEIPDIKLGHYLRWIKLTDPDNLRLTQGGIACSIRATDDGVLIVCKNSRNQMFSFKLQECMVFQKLTYQEQVLLSAMDYLNS